MTVPPPNEPIPTDPQLGPSGPDVSGQPPSPVDSTEQPKTEAQIDKELADSFPSSDPPSSWAGAD